MHRRTRSRLLTLTAVVAVALGATPALGLATAHADGTSTWALRSEGLTTPGDPYSGLYNGQYAAASAGPTGTVIASADRYVSNFSELSRLELIVIGPGPNGTVTRSSPLPDVMPSFFKVAADPATGNAAVLASVGSPPSVVGFTYSGSTHAWSAPHTFIAPTGNANGVFNFGLTVTGSTARVGIASYVLSSQYTNSVTAYEWPIGSEPGAAVSLYSSTQSGTPGQGQNPDTLDLQSGVDGAGVTHFTWTSKTGYSATTYQDDPSNRVWTLSEAHTSAAADDGWSDPSQLLTPTAAEWIRPQMFERSGSLVAYVQRRDLTSPGTAGNFYSDATYSRTARTFAFQNDGSTVTTPLSASVDLYAGWSSTWPRLGGQFDSVTSSMLVVDPAAAGSMRSVPTPPTNNNAVSAAAFRSDGALVVLGPCAGAATHRCTFVRTDLTGAGTWTALGQLPDTITDGLPIVVADAASDAGFYAILPAARTGGGTDLIRAYDDLTAPTLDPPSVNAKTGSLPLYANGDVQIGGVVSIGGPAWDTISRTHQEFRISVDGTVISDWTTGVPVTTNIPELDFAIGTAEWTATTLGQHTALLEARDEAHNVASASTVFTVAQLMDKTPPANLLYSPNLSPVGQGVPFTLTKISGHDDRSTDAHTTVVVTWGDGTTTSGTLATTSFSHTYSTDGTVSWSVTATDEANNTSTDGPHDVTVALPPAPAATLSALALDRSVRLRWSRTTGPSYSLTTSVTVRVSPATTTGKTSFTLPASAMTTTITGLRNGTAYTFLVRPETAVGPSPWSRAASATPIGSPARPTNLKAAKLPKGKTKLTWRIPASTKANPVVGYKVYVNGKLVRTLTSRTAKSWTHGGEKAGKKYTYKIVAYNAVGTSKATTLTKKRS